MAELLRLEAGGATALVRIVNVGNPSGGCSTTKESYGIYMTRMDQVLYIE